MSHSFTPLFSVEGQKVEAIRELRKQPFKMAIVLEYEQERTGRVQYTYELRNVTQINVGADWPSMPGWIGKVRAVIYPWEVIPTQILNFNF